MNKFAVIAVDISETSDHKGHILETYDKREDAVAFVKGDMERFVEDAQGMKLEVDEAKMSVSTSDGQYGCEWSIEEIKL